MIELCRYQIRGSHITNKYEFGVVVLEPYPHIDSAQSFKA